MNPYAEARGRNPGCAAAWVALGDTPDWQVAKQPIQRLSGFGLHGLAEPGVVLRYRQISLGERLTEASDDLLPLTVANSDAGISVGSVMRSPR